MQVSKMSPVGAADVMALVILWSLRIPSSLAAEGSTGAPDSDLRQWSELTDEQRLLKNLLFNYDNAVRPVFDAKRPVVINLGITLTQIIDVDEKNQVLTTNVWLDQDWTDEKLQWNITDFANISIMRIPCDLIWLPDIVLYNSVENHNKGYMRALAMVENNGHVFWPPIVRMRSSCKMDITYFPFDDQICILKLGSWAYDGLQVDVTNRTVNIDLSNYVDNGEWELMGTRIIRNVKFYPCCPEPFPDVMFYLHMRRRVLYYLLNVIIPCMLLSSLSLTGFLLPPESGEKVTLGLTVLLAFSVFMLLVAENMPPTSEYIPLIGIYLTVIMAMSALSVALSVFVLNCHHRGSLLHRPPRLVRTLAQAAARVMCMGLRYLPMGGSAPSCRGPSMPSSCGGGGGGNNNHNHRHHHHRHHHPASAPPSPEDCPSDTTSHTSHQTHIHTSPEAGDGVRGRGLGLNGLIGGGGGGGGVGRGGGRGGGDSSPVWTRHEINIDTNDDTNTNTSTLNNNPYSDGVRANNTTNIFFNNEHRGGGGVGGGGGLFSSTPGGDGGGVRFCTETGGGEMGGGGGGERGEMGGGSIRECGNISLFSEALRGIAEGGGNNNSHLLTEALREVDGHNNSHSGGSDSGLLGRGGGGGGGGEGCRFRGDCGGDHCEEGRGGGGGGSRGEEEGRAGRGGGGERGVGSLSRAARLERDILQYLRAVLEAHERCKVERVAVNEWQEVARVLDKLFFWLFVIITSTSTLVLLVFSPMIKDVNVPGAT